MIAGATTQTTHIVGQRDVADAATYGRLTRDDANLGGSTTQDLRETLGLFGHLLDYPRSEDARLQDPYLYHTASHHIEPVLETLQQLHFSHEGSTPLVTVEDLRIVGLALIGHDIAHPRNLYKREGLEGWTNDTGAAAFARDHFGYEVTAQQIQAIYSDFVPWYTRTSQAPAPEVLSAAVWRNILQTTGVPEEEIHQVIDLILHATTFPVKVAQEMQLGPSAEFSPQQNFRIALLALLDIGQPVFANDGASFLSNSVRAHYDLFLKLKPDVPEELQFVLFSRGFLNNVVSTRAAQLSEYMQNDRRDRGAQKLETSQETEVWERWNRLITSFQGNVESVRNVLFAMEWSYVARNLDALRGLKEKSPQVFDELGIQKSFDLAVQDDLAAGGADETSSVIPYRFRNASRMMPPQIASHSRHGSHSAVA